MSLLGYVIRTVSLLGYVIRTVSLLGYVIRTVSLLGYVIRTVSLLGYVIRTVSLLGYVIRTVSLLGYVIRTVSLSWRSVFDLCFKECLSSRRDVKSTSPKQPRSCQSSDTRYVIRIEISVCVIIYRDMLSCVCVHYTLNYRARSPTDYTVCGRAHTT